MQKWTGKQSDFGISGWKSVTWPLGSARYSTRKDKKKFLSCWIVYLYAHKKNITN